MPEIVRRLNWRKARHSVSNGACVEAASAAGSVRVRDSQDAKGPVLSYPEGAWQSFVRDARAGMYDAR
jgi:uncharacterized protein DUF397